MLQNFQRIIQTEITAAEDGLLEMRVPFAGEIRKLSIWLGAALSAGVGEVAMFTLSLNGVAVWTGDDRLGFADGMASASKVGLSVVVAAGDLLSIDLVEMTADPIEQPIMINVQIDDLDVDEVGGGTEMLSGDVVGVPANTRVVSIGGVGIALKMQTLFEDDFDGSGVLNAGNWITVDGDDVARVSGKLHLLSDNTAPFNDIFSRDGLDFTGRELLIDVDTFAAEGMTIILAETAGSSDGFFAFVDAVTAEWTINHRIGGNNSPESTPVFDPLAKLLRLRHDPDTDIFTLASFKNGAWTELYSFDNDGENWLEACQLNLGTFGEAGSNWIINQITSTVVLSELDNTADLVLSYNALRQRWQPKPAASMVQLDAEDVQDIVGAMMSAGNNTSWIYNDELGTLSVDATHLTDEQIQDKIAAALSAGTGITINYNDAGNTIEITNSGTAGVTAEQVMDIVADLLDAGSNVSLTYNDGTDSLVIAATGGGSLPARATITTTTALLGNLTSESGTVALGKSFELLKLVADHYCRVRLYSTAAARAADAARAFGTAVAVGTQHGLIADVQLDAVTGLSWIMSPKEIGSNMDEPATTSIYYNIENRSGSSNAVSVTFTRNATE